MYFDPNKGSHNVIYENGRKLVFDNRGGNVTFTLSPKIKKISLKEAYDIIPSIPR